MEAFLVKIVFVAANNHSADLLMANEPSLAFQSVVVELAKQMCARGWL